METVNEFKSKTIKDDFQEIIASCENKYESIKDENDAFSKAWSNFFYKHNELLDEKVIRWLMEAEKPGKTKVICTEEEAKNKHEKNKKENTNYINTTKGIKPLEFNGKRYILNYLPNNNKEEFKKTIVEYIEKLMSNVEYIKELISNKIGRNLIIYGAPGTGKSYHVEHNMNLDKDKITRVVFHPEYTYFDFVGQYRPSPLYKKNNAFVSVGECGEEKCEPFIDYAFVPGPFTNVLVEAWKAWDNWKKEKEKENNKEDKMPMYTLLIEELNRADAAAVFGDVFQLLDRKNGISEYDIKPSKEWGEYIYKELSKCEKSLAELGIKNTKERITSDGLRIKIPENMNIIATMNSADQGVYMLDTAFKRRWDYYFVPIQYNDKELNIEIEYNNGKYTWKQIIKAINERLIDDGPNISEDRLIGPYFVKPDKIKSNPDEAIRKILFYLWDDVLRNNGRKEIFGEENKTMNDLYENYKNGADVLKIKDILPPNDQAKNDKIN